MTGPAPLDPFGRSAMPRTASREGRVAMLQEVARALLEDAPCSREAALFVAGAVDAYLRYGGNLARDYLRIVPPRGSHSTPAAIVRAAHRDERQADLGGPIIGASNKEATE